MQSVILGIDEAGRGSVIGSMFIAGFAVENGLEPDLVELGVKDSKLFTTEASRKRRENIAAKLTDIGQSFIREVLPGEIDNSLLDKKDNLNLLEIRHFAVIIVDAVKTTDVETVYIDAISKPLYTLEKLLSSLKTANIFTKLSIIRDKGILNGIIEDGRKIQIIAENKADSKYPAVAAASIIAKNAREHSLRKLERNHGFQDHSLGAGYPNENDTAMMAFLESITGESELEHYGFFRYTWKWKNPVWKRIVAEHVRERKDQKALSMFFKE